MGFLYDLAINPYQVHDCHTSQWSLAELSVRSGCSSGFLVSGVSCCTHSWAGLDSMLYSQTQSLSVKAS